MEEWAQGVSANPLHLGAREPWCVPLCAGHGLKPLPAAQDVEQAEQDAAPAAEPPTSAERPGVGGVAVRASPVAARVFHGRRCGREGQGRGETLRGETAGHAARAPAPLGVWDGPRAARGAGGPWGVGGR